MNHTRYRFSTEINKPLLLHLRSCFIPTILLATVFLSGCSKEHLAGRPKRTLDLKKIEKIAEKNEGTFDLIKIVETYYAEKSTSETRKSSRNLLIDKSLILMDARYELFLDDFSAGKKSLDAGADIASMAADSVATLVTPASTKSILAAISGGITASKISFDEAFFYEKTLPVLLKQMEANRQSVLVDLTKGRQLSDELYPLTSTLRDLSRYYTAGTIDGALIEIQQQASDKQKDAKTKIKNELDNQIIKAKGEFERTLTWLNSNPHMVLTAKTAIKIWWSKLDHNQPNIISKAASLTQWAKNAGFDIANEPFKQYATNTGNRLAIGKFENFIDSLPTTGPDLQKTKTYFANIYSSTSKLTVPK